MKCPNCGSKEVQALFGLNRQRKNYGNLYTLVGKVCSDCDERWDISTNYTSIQEE